MEHMLQADSITREYVKGKDIGHQRVFLARSDPAMNYGLISAVLLNKMALQRLHLLSLETGMEICPIIGVGSAPFRGDLRPKTAGKVLREYPIAYTFTIQSALKYDNPPGKVRDTAEKLKDRKPKKPHAFNEERCLELIGRYCREYQKHIVSLAPAINKVARYVPARRKRKLHVGLFGYSRNLGGVKLPRVITFTAALYSIGIPPEVLGLSALSAKDLDFVKESYVNFEACISEALKYYNQQTTYLPKGLKAAIKGLDLDYETDAGHRKITDQIVRGLGRNETE